MVMDDHDNQDTLGVISLQLAVIADKMATKDDVASLRTETKEQIESLRTETTEQIESLRTETKEQIATVRSEMATKEELRHQGILMETLGDKVDAILEIVVSEHELKERADNHKQRITSLEQHDVIVRSAIKDHSQRIKRLENSKA